MTPEERAKVLFADIFNSIWAKANASRNTVELTLEIHTKHIKEAQREAAERAVALTKQACWEYLMDLDPVYEYGKDFYISKLQRIDKDLFEQAISADNILEE